MILKLGYYRHYKGNVYCVTGIGIYTESGEALAIYQKWNVDINGLEEPIWVRPVKMFYEVVTDYQGVNVPRFVRLPDNMQGGCK